VIVQQFKPLPDISVKNMLLRLQNYNGLFFLQGSPHSVIGLLPKKQWLFNQSGGFIELSRQGLDTAVTPKNENFDSYLQNSWQQCQGVFLQDLALKNQKTVIPSAGFNGGLMGFISYDQAASRHIQSNNNASQPVTSVFGEYDIFFKQKGAHWVLYGPDDEQLTPLYQHIAAQVQHTAIDAGLTLATPFASCWSFENYQQAFQKVQHYLKQGDCYQVNLTQPFKAKAQGHLSAALDDLLQLSNAPYAAYTRVKDTEILSCSPELFIEFHPARKFITKPIKGTRPRHADTTLDQQQKRQLIESEKDRSENLMIVDLLRNDLGKYAETGSVKVTSLFHIESFAQVHHMVSDIEATLKADSTPLQVLLDSLPGGSITGAPKIRAMQIIDELEYEARGAYCGSMGYLNYDDTGCFNILIRTLQKQGDTITAWAGGGITIASTCKAEYQECFDKISAILNCLNQYHTPDTE
jgi:para-aminobenzoate synthetase component 1